MEAILRAVFSCTHSVPPHHIRSPLGPISGGRVSPTTPFFAPHPRVTESAGALMREIPALLRT